MLRIQWAGHVSEKETKWTFLLSIRKGLFKICGHILEVFEKLILPGQLQRQEDQRKTPRNLPSELELVDGETRFRGTRKKTYCLKFAIRIAGD